MATTLETALAIVEVEVAKLARLAQDVDPIDKAHSAMLTDYIKVLVSVKKDDRESFKAEDLESKSDTELQALLADAVAYLEETGEE